MTNSNHTVEETVAVIQADRDAAADFTKEDALRSARWDEHYAVQAFARHRLASHSTPAGEDVERVARAICLAKALKGGVFFDHEEQKRHVNNHWRDHIVEARAAIAAMASLPNTDAHDELVEALENLVAFAESVEAKALVGDEGCLWPVEFARVALTKAKAQP